MVPSSPSCTVASQCPHHVHTASSEICNAALKYVLPLWNMYCLSEICIDTPKCVLTLRNMYWHSEISYSDCMHTLANHHHAVKYGHRPTNGSITASYRPHVLLSSSYQGLTVCHHLYPHPAKSFEHAQNFSRVSPVANGQPTCSPIAQRPTVCPHRVPPSARNLPHSGTWLAPCDSYIRF